MARQLTPLVAASVEGFIQQVAVAYFPHGYWFFVTGWIPEHKNAETVDSKLVHRYGAHASRWTRARRKLHGLANVRYLRHGRFFILAATHGEHPFFAEESASIRDARRTPLKYAGYAVSFRGGHAHVRIEQEEYKRLKAYALELATHRAKEPLETMMSRLPYEPYAPVRRQLLNVLRAINRKRRSAGFAPLHYHALRLRRRIVRPFRQAVTSLVEHSTVHAPVEQSEAEASGEHRWGTGA